MISGTTVICDLDGVLWGDEWKAEYFRLLDKATSLGLEAIAAVYELVKEERGHHDIDFFLGKLSEASGVSSDKLRGDIEQFLGEHADDYLFDDAIGFLRKLVHADCRVVILTTGTAWFQTLKITPAINRYVDEVHVVPGLKNGAVGRLIAEREGTVYLVEDSAYQIEAVRDDWSGVITVFVDRKRDGDTDLANYHVHSLREAKEIPW
jgi:phosphoserine phosphatase